MDTFLTKVWRNEHQPSFWKVDKDMLLVSFGSEKDMLKVLTGGPWLFEGSIIVMEKWVAGMTEEDFVNTKVYIWAQIRRLPFELRCFKYAKSMAKYAGCVVENDEVQTNQGTDYCSNFVRVRLQIDLNKPLVPCLFLKRPNRKPAWIPFKYERLPNICYNCGLMNHETRSCKFHVDGKERAFGNWLRAEEVEVLSIPWSEESEMNGDYIFVSMPEKAAAQSPTTTVNRQPTISICDDSSQKISNVAA